MAAGVAGRARGLAARGVGAAGGIGGSELDARLATRLFAFALALSAAVCAALASAWPGPRWPPAARCRRMFAPFAVDWAVAAFESALFALLLAWLAVACARLAFLRAFFRDRLGRGQGAGDGIRRASQRRDCECQGEKHAHAQYRVTLAHTVSSSSCPFSAQDCDADIRSHPVGRRNTFLAPSPTDRCPDADCAAPAGAQAEVVDRLLHPNAGQVNLLGAGERLAPRRRGPARAGRARSGLREGIVELAGLLAAIGRYRQLLQACPPVANDGTSAAAKAPGPPPELAVPGRWAAGDCASRRGRSPRPRSCRRRGECRSLPRQGRGR